MVWDYIKIGVLNVQRCKSNCLTKYNCPLCRYDIYSSLQKLGFPPLQIEEDEDNQDDEHYDNAIIIISSILEIISNTFSPLCFHNTITSNENGICQICKNNFINLIQTSENLDTNTQIIVDIYNEHPQGIIYLMI